MVLPQEGAYSAPRRYLCSLKQEGTNDPVAIVYQAGFEVVWSRQAAGSYLATIPGVTLQEGEAIMIVGAGNGSSDYSYGAEITGGGIALNSAEGGVDGDDRIDGLAVEIILK